MKSEVLVGGNFFSITQWEVEISNAEVESHTCLSSVLVGCFGGPCDISSPLSTCTSSSLRQRAFTTVPI